MKFIVIFLSLDAWMKGAETQLDDVKNKSDTMTPEDRVTQTMDLLEDIREKVDALMEYVLQEEELLPQGKSNNLFILFLIPQWSLNSLLRKKRFMLDEKFWQNASKFAI